MIVRFVTTNTGKLKEARAALAGLGHEVVGHEADILEIQADTLDDVAAFKAQNLADVVETPFFVEDAGLFVHALNGFPGVYSAYVHRTVGWEGLLRLMDDVADGERSAHFEAVVAYVDGTATVRTFRGRVEGVIGRQGIGEGGFGFDPVFVPNEGDGSTFAQMPPEEKNRLSHRGRALASLASHLATEQNG